MKACLLLCAILVLCIRFGSALRIPFLNDSNEDILRIPFLDGEDIIEPDELEYRGLFSKKTTINMVQRELKKFRFKKGPEPKYKNKKTQGVDPMITSVVEKFKKTVRVGLPTYGVPILDPLTIEDVELRIRDLLIRSKIEIRNVEIKGLSDFEIEVLKVDYSNYTFYFAFVFPLFKIDLDYIINAHIVKFFPFTIGGHVNWISENIDISGMGALRIEGGLGLNGFDMVLDIKKNELKISRIFGLSLIDRGLSWILNKFANVWFNLFKKKVSIMISDGIYNTVNSALKGVSLTSLMFGI